MNTINKKTALLLFSVVVIATAGFLLYSLETTTQKQVQLSEQTLLQEAIAHFDNMVVTRSWNALYGGVYVKQSAGLTPNPYLKNNTLKDSAGNTLVRINPAWMTRQISELSNQKSRYFYKITSLKPINPHNVPDTFETKALQYFETHRDKRYYSQLNTDKASFDFMGVLRIEPACLSCHDGEGYKIGDSRGGIRVSIPTDLFREEMQTIALQTRNSQIFIVLSAGLILLIFSRFICTLYAYQKNIEQLNKSLEKTVQERTHSLEKMYQHEKYIKDLLKTVSSVNELLLSSISVQCVLRNSTEELTKHQHYRFTWVGLIKNECVEIAHKSADDNSILADNAFSLNSIGNEATAAAVQAITQNRTVIQPYTGQQPYQGRRSGDYVLYWLVAIPLLAHDSERPFGVFTIYSDRESGFEAEEINVLERLSTDIGLILYSHKQKAILEQMEIDKVSNYEETILAFVNIIEQRDTYTAGHTIRVAEYCKKIAVALGIASEDIKKLERAAILHDIGKVATPDAVLLKPGRLTSLEYELIKQHAYAGYNMLAKIDMYKDLAEIIRYHHVRYDGNGYPATQSPDDVPFLSHIMAVADAFDAMTSNRIYKPRQTVADALQEIERYSGSQFHPIVAKVAIAVLQDIQVSNTAQTPNSELEQKRFSYFFCDALTELYNENYLKVVLSNSDMHYASLYCVLLSNFSQYNKKYGWDQGNNLLIQLAKTLREQFPQALVFRYHGDDFVLLFTKPIVIDDCYFIELPLLADNNIHVQVKRLTADNDNVYDVIMQNGLG